MAQTLWGEGVRWSLLGDSGNQGRVPGRPRVTGVQPSVCGRPKGLEILWEVTG
jgi:hypothetical protein